jgi:hypothetical protein
MKYLGEEHLAPKHYRARVVSTRTLRGRHAQSVQALPCVSRARPHLSRGHAFLVAGRSMRMTPLHAR